MFLNDEIPGFFKDYHRSFRRTVTNDQINQFSKLDDDEDRIRFVFSIPAAHDIDVRQFFKGKSEKEALEKKEAGNICFGKKKNMEALKLYSQAVLKAPVPTGKYWKLIKECADPKKMTLYAICLANRSAALYHLREYYYCIKDIDEALEHHYPRELKYKLYKRKGRLLTHLKQHIDARDAYRQALKWLDWAKMDREKRITIQTEIQKWLKLYEQGKCVKNWEGHEPDMQFFPPVPELCQAPNDRFPSLSKKAEIRYENNQGRFAVAAEDIEPGDTICVEKAFAAVLLREEFGAHCQKCFMLCKAPIPCKKCSAVVFCSTECRNESYFHTIECGIQDLLLGSGMSINCFLAFRLLSQTPFSEFLEMKEKLKKDDPKDATNNKEIYNPADFLRLYNLVTHSESRTTEDYLHRCLMVVFFLKSLKTTKYFKGHDAGPTYPMFIKEKMDKISDKEAFAGALMLHFIEVVQFNAHEVSEFILPAPRILAGSKNESLGAAIYPTLALFNHSCHTGQVRYFSGTTVITKAIRNMRKGEIIPENYGQSFTSKQKAQRKADLKSRYWFDCMCEACQNDWPMYKDMNDTIMKFKCHKCQAPILVNSETVMMPFFKCEKCGDQTNILSALNNLKNTDQTFKAARKEMEQYNLDKAEALLEENLRQLESNLHPPYRDYHLCQEAYMRVMLSKGNVKAMKPKLEE